MFLKLQSKYSKTYAPLNEKYYLYKVNKFINFLALYLIIFILQSLMKVVHKEQRDYLNFCLKQARNCSPIDYEYVLPGLVDYIERTLFVRKFFAHTKPVFIFIPFFAATSALCSRGVRGSIPPALGDRHA